MSRKISNEAAYAFDQQVKFTKSNTRVAEADGYWVLYLHGNVIARTPRGKAFYLHGEVCTQGWASLTTFERLNALPGVSVFTHNGYTFLNNRPWTRDDAWTSVQDGEDPEKCGKTEAKARKETCEFIDSLPHLGQLDIRTRKGEPIHRYQVKGEWGPLEVYSRPWAAEPRGEIHVPGHKRIRFSRWVDFSAAWEDANELAAPDLVRLAKVAGEDRKEKA